ncbi:hypothetical protein [Chitinophaga tropicalis]|uniref:Lipocalin-like protein n=1 Tax=Chitinophaga tropicalis TaxID=2683588 RepID=A0A7K1U3I3_9BACT|nr:hypothetical protein [Chitinophaga tropicalis]MVT08846.1 hypothetical protein [Chitinophaga tropicalis]
MKKPYPVNLSCVIALFAVLSTGIVSCSNSDDDVTPTGPGGGDTTSSMTRLLTDSIWRYYEYYQSYSDAASKMVWKKGRDYNTLNLLSYKVKFNTDHTYWEVTGSVDSVKGTWAFTDSETKISIKHNKGSYVYTVKLLGTNQFEWEDTNNKTYGLLLKRFPETERMKSWEQMLTFNTWKYDTYIKNYTKETADLLWRAGKTNPAVNMMSSRLTLKTDGSYQATTETGAIVSGLWEFGSGEDQITLKPTGQTSYTLSIKLLNDTRLEWHRADNDTYGEMVLIDPTE